MTFKNPNELNDETRDFLWRLIIDKSFRDEFFSNPEKKNPKFW